MSSFHRIFFREKGKFPYNFFCKLTYKHYYFAKVAIWPFYMVSRKKLAISCFLDLEENRKLKDTIFANDTIFYEILKLFLRCFGKFFSKILWLLGTYYTIFCVLRREHVYYNGRIAKRPKKTRMRRLVCISAAGCNDLICSLIVPTGTIATTLP